MPGGECMAILLSGHIEAKNGNVICTNKKGCMLNFTNKAFVYLFIFFFSVDCAVHFLSWSFLQDRLSFHFLLLGFKLQINKVNMWDAKLCYWKQ